MKEFSIVEIAAIGVAICLAPYLTARFLTDTLKARAPLGKRSWRYIKKVFDALWGAG